MWLLFRAEWRKITGNRWLAGCLIGIWPVVATLISLAVILLAGFNDDIHQRLIDEPAKWTSASLFFWVVPNSIFGRLLIIGFTATLFGGEYQWGTWKHLLPRRGRIVLILAKYLTLGIFIISAFTMTSIIWVIGRGLAQLAAGSTYPPALNEIPSGYWSQLAVQVSIAFVTTLIIAAVAGLAALITRSILASIIVAVFAAIMDGFFAAGVFIMYIVTGERFFPNLFRFTVSYNADNMLNWVTDQRSTNVLGNLRMEANPLFGEAVIDPPIPGHSLENSILIMLVWMLALVGLSIYSFYRQDVVT